MFRVNPDEFIAKVGKIIHAQKATTIASYITYNLTDKTYDNDIFSLDKSITEYEAAMNSNKHILDKVFVDGYAKDGNSVESRMAKELDLAEEVVVYAKLPRTFLIPTPVGDYSPDWAIAFKKDMVKHVYFIAETKGSMESFELKKIEATKIDCARRLFNNLSNANIRYDFVTGYDQLLNLVRED
jgi:type III restriction enzyme